MWQRMCVCCLKKMQKLYLYMYFKTKPKWSFRHIWLPEARKPTHSTKKACYCASWLSFSLLDFLTTHLRKIMCIDRQFVVINFQQMRRYVKICFYFVVGISLHYFAIFVCLHLRPFVQQILKNKIKWYNYVFSFRHSKNLLLHFYVAFLSINIITICTKIIIYNYDINNNKLE